MELYYFWKDHFKLKFPLMVHTCEDLVGRPTGIVVYHFANFKLIYVNLSAIKPLSWFQNLLR